MGEYKLTDEADEDLYGIFLYGLQNFGLEQSVKYQMNLRKRFHEITKFPFSYQSVDFIAPGYRRIVYYSHSIFYRVEVWGVSIARILKYQDHAKAFSIH